MNKGHWVRETPFSSSYDTEYTEIWSYLSEEESDRFLVDIKIGKALDVSSLKGMSLSDSEDYSLFLDQTAQKMFGSPDKLIPVTDCVVCAHKLNAKNIVIRVFDVDYIRCQSCGHVMVAFQPKPDKMEQHFAESDEHASIYLDEETIKSRMAQVVTPKLTWLEGVFKKQSGRRVQNLLDIGAGGGHFVYGAQQSGINAQGYELSHVSREFAKQAFDVDLSPKNFLDKDYNHNDCDVITMWGLLEYVQKPQDFIRQARSLLKPDGLLIVEVPRVDALGTQIQSMDGAVVARHMDPTSHVNSFSDESLCTLLYSNGFQPVAAWFFGLDAYEMLVQVALKYGGEEAYRNYLSVMPIVQKVADLGRQCDDIILAVKPRENIVSP